MLLRSTIYQMMRRAILTNEFHPGQELREQWLAERYRVSRSPIRDALLRLQVENLTTVLPRKGYLIRPLAQPDAEEIFDFRSVVEPACTAKASMAGRADRVALDRFRSVVQPDDTMLQYIEYDSLFHIAIANLAGNPRMLAIASDLTEQIVRLQQITLPTGDHEAARRDCTEHDLIINAVQDGDADRAFRLCHAHTNAAHERILAALRRHVAAEDSGTGQYHPSYEDDASQLA